MINLKSLLKENTKNVKILIRNKVLGDQNVSFLIFIQGSTFILLPKSSKDLDKLEPMIHQDIVDGLLTYLEKHTKLSFKWSISYNTHGAGYGFDLDLDKIMEKLK